MASRTQWNSYTSYISTDHANMTADTTEMTTPITLQKGLIQGLVVQAPQCQVTVLELQALGPVCLLWPFCPGAPPVHELLFLWKSGQSIMSQYNLCTDRLAQHGFDDTRIQHTCKHDPIELLAVTAQDLEPLCKYCILRAGHQFALQGSARLARAILELAFKMHLWIGRERA